MQILEKERKRLCETTVSDYIIYNYICSFVLHRFLFDETRDRSGSACGSDRRAIHSEFCDLYGAGKGKKIHPVLQYKETAAVVFQKPPVWEEY